MSEEYTRQQLIELMPCAWCTIVTYLCRPEFNHIKRKVVNRRYIYTNFRDGDIEKLKQIISCRTNIKEQRHYYSTDNYIKGV